MFACFVFVFVFFFKLTAWDYLCCIELFLITGKHTQSIGDRVAIFAVYKQEKAVVNTFYWNAEILPLIYLKFISELVKSSGWVYLFCNNSSHPRHKTSLMGGIHTNIIEVLYVSHNHVKVLPLIKSELRICSCDEKKNK